MACVELHARSAFSFLRAAPNPEHLGQIAARRDLAALVLCDRNGVYGAPRLYAEAKKAGVKAIVGCELILEDGAVLPVLVKTRQG